MLVVSLFACCLLVASLALNGCALLFRLCVLVSVITRVSTCWFFVLVLSSSSVNVLLCVLLVPVVLISIPSLCIALVSWLVVRVRVTACWLSFLGLRLVKC